METTKSVIDEALVRASRIVDGACMENNQAKQSEGPEREAHYWAKDNAINLLLEHGYASVNAVDWSRNDPVLCVRFADGRQLHTKLSSLNLGAFRVLRRQLDGGLTPREPLADGGALDSSWTAWHRA
jgi:hypothetical protein